MGGREAEGWTPGPARDDDAKQHPGLVPYAELPEAEREVDRRTVRAALAGLEALGYRLDPPG